MSATTPTSATMSAAIQPATVLHTAHYDNDFPPLPLQRPQSPNLINESGLGRINVKQLNPKRIKPAPSQMVSYQNYERSNAKVIQQSKKIKELKDKIDQLQRDKASLSIPDMLANIDALHAAAHSEKLQKQSHTKISVPPHLLSGANELSEKLLETYEGLKKKLKDKYS